MGAARRAVRGREREGVRRRGAERFRQYDLTYPAISDRSGESRSAYGVTALPETFFISAGGDIVGEVAGSPSVRQLEMGAAAARVRARRSGASRAAAGCRCR